MQMQRVEQIGQTQPQDLDTDTKDCEGKQPHRDLRARRPKQPFNMSGKAHAKINADAKQSQGKPDADEMNGLQAFPWRAGAQRNGDGN
jgi:hypothetical protein